MRIAKPYIKNAKPKSLFLLCKAKSKTLQSPNNYLRATFHLKKSPEVISLVQNSSFSGCLTVLSNLLVLFLTRSQLLLGGRYACAARNRRGLYAARLLLFGHFESGCLCFLHIFCFPPILFLRFGKFLL
jgi:hypothetical protein